MTWEGGIPTIEIVKEKNDARKRVKEKLVMFIITAHGLRSIHLLIFNQRTELPYPSMLFLTPYTRSRNKNQHFVFAKYLAS